MDHSCDKASRRARGRAGAFVAAGTNLVFESVVPFDDPSTNPTAVERRAGGVNQSCGGAENLRPIAFVVDRCRRFGFKGHAEVLTLVG